MSLWTFDDINSGLCIDFSDPTTLFDATSGGSVVTNGVAIARAEDKSGRERDFTEGSFLNRPTWFENVINGLGVARFDGNDRLTSVQGLGTWTFLHSVPSTIFAVVKSGTTASPGLRYGWLGNNATAAINRGVCFMYDDRNIFPGLTNALSCTCADSGGVTAYQFLNGAGTEVVTDFRDILTAGVFQLNTISSDPANATAANRIKISVNGGAFVGNNQRTGASSTGLAGFNLQIGTAGNNQAPLTGDYAFLGIVNGPCPTDVVEKAQGYLAHRFGMTADLPSDHPYRYYPPTKSRLRRIVRSLPPAMTRNDVDGSFGYRFQTRKAFKVTALGRPIGSIFNQTHAVSLWDNGGGLLGTVNITPTSPRENGWAYEMLSVPVFLGNGFNFRISSTEYNGGDNWQTQGTFTAHSTADMDLVNQAYATTLDAWPNLVGGATSAWVWPTFYEGSPFEAGLQRRTLFGGNL